MAVVWKILIVDDKQENRELLRDILHAEKITTITAENGVIALQQLEKHAPDLILLDVHMPLMDGIEVCRRIKSNPETRLLPVVMVTGTSQSAERLMGIEAGADDFLIKPIDRGQLIARVRSLLSLKEFTDELERAENVLFALARSIEGKDPYTHGHCERLSNYSASLGAALGLGTEDVNALRRAGIVHDIGKVAVPDSILLKPGKLTTEEYRIMKHHPIVGEQICAPLKSFKLVLPIIRHHHEKMDGSGYPDGLSGDQIPLTARVMSICDVFDALSTERPYKEAMQREEVLQVMSEEVAKGWWDPELFQVFQGFFAPVLVASSREEAAWL